MQVKALCKLVILGSITMSLVACGTKNKSAEAASGVGDTMRFYGTQLTPEQERQLLSKKVFYFGYDRFELDDQDMLSVYAHAKKIITHPRCQVRIEGHTDERGSREYNIALGENRGKAIANILLLKGVPQNQITVVSFGKEKPAQLGHDESAWRLNRRAVLEYEVE